MARGFEPWTRGPGNQRRRIMQALESRYTGSEMIVGLHSHWLLAAGRRASSNEVAP